MIDLAVKRIRDEQIIPDYVKINWMNYDDECDAALSTIFAVDAFSKRCSHFIIGPSCEYSVAAVSRIAKYFYNNGLNGKLNFKVKIFLHFKILFYFDKLVLTGGALSFDFVQPKRTCKDQFHMLSRVGQISFENIAHFTIKIMNNFSCMYKAIN